MTALPRLSITIATFNRAEFIGATLESILSQITSDCEVVVLDGGSTDGTELVVWQYLCAFKSLRYIRQDVRQGVDQDYDRAVELANGEFCWLMTDDDHLKPGAVEAVLQVLNCDVSFVFVNGESRDVNMSRVVRHRWLDLDANRVYSPDEIDRLFVEVGELLKYIGSIVVDRRMWLSRERRRYYGSWFIYLGVIFQERLPGNAVVIAAPFVSYRMGNEHAFSSRLFEIMFVKWPSLVWSLALTESTKRSVCRAEPWRDGWELLRWRGMGFYSLVEYRRVVRPQLRSTGEAFVPVLVALLPGVLLNAIFVLYYSVFHGHGGRLQAMKDSRFHPLRRRAVDGEECR